MITTHVLDTASGLPAAGVPVALERRANGGEWHAVARGKTDTDGRLQTLTTEGAPIESGVYRLVFDTAKYFKTQVRRAFFPTVTVTFHITDASAHYHVPLLLSPFGYSTYRGS